MDPSSPQRPRGGRSGEVGQLGRIGGSAGAVDRLARAGVAPLIDEIFIRFKGGGFFHEYVQINGEWQVINEPPPPRNQLQKVYFEWKDLVSSVHPWPG